MLFLAPLHVCRTNASIVGVDERRSLNSMEKELKGDRSIVSPLGFLNGYRIPRLLLKQEALCLANLPKYKDGCTVAAFPI